MHSIMSTQCRMFLIVLLLCGIFSTNILQVNMDESVVIPDGSFVPKEPIIVLPRFGHRSVKCFQGSSCSTALSCLLSSKLIDC